MKALIKILLPFALVGCITDPEPRVQHQREGQTESLGITLNRLGILAEVNPQHGETLSRKIPLQALEHRHLGTALGTPGGPEVHQHDASV